MHLQQHHALVSVAWLRLVPQGALWRHHLLPLAGRVLELLLLGLRQVG